MSGNAAASQATLEGRVARENARIARMNADNILQAGAAAEEAKRRQIQRDIGTTAAAMSQAGTGGPSVGSNALLIKQASTEAEFDAQNLRYGYASDAYGQKVEALNQDAAGLAAKRRARAAQTSGWINAASTVLNAGSSYSGMRAQQAAAANAPFAGHEVWHTAGSSGGLVPYHF